MTARLIRLIPILASGCVLGDEAPNDTGVDAPEPVPTVALSGRTLDYFSGAVVGTVAVETMGLAPEQSTLATDVGDFEFEAVPEHSWLFLRASASSTHAATLAEFVVGESDADADVLVVSSADLRRQHATVGVPVDPGSTMVIVSIVDVSGAPLAGISRSDLALLDSAGTVIGSEPFVFGALGDVDDSLAVSEIHGGVARFAFLNVGPGVHQLALTCSMCEPAIETMQTVVATAGVSLVQLAVEATAQPDETSLDSLLPLFGRGSDGGLGCANCHTAGGASTLVLDGAADDVRAALLATPGAIDTNNPDASLLLSKPLYEVPANHPNATFLDQSDSDYQRLRSWIEAGAQ